jgi:putative two-component system response regulator
MRSLTDPRDGAELFKTFGPDLCLLDFNMPRLTGADVFQQFKTIDPTVEVIFLTAEAETSLAIDLMKAGAIDYLLKPVNLNCLAASVGRALEHRRLVRANLEYQQHLEDLVAQKTVALTDALASLAGMHAGTLDALGTALDFRDQSTSGHSRRVALWTTGIARIIGITGEALGQVEQGVAFRPDNGCNIAATNPGSLTKWPKPRRYA